MCLFPPSRSARGLALLPCRLHSPRQGARICRLVSHIRKTWKHRLYVVLAIVPASGQQRVRMGEPGGPIYQVDIMAIEPRPQRCFAIPRSHCGATSDAIGLPIVFRSIEPGSTPVEPIKHVVWSSRSGTDQPTVSKRGGRLVLAPDRSGFRQDKTISYIARFAGKLQQPTSRNACHSPV